MRVGIGYDIHALRKGRRLVLGGVQVPFSKGLFGHSDGDVLFHAAVDAVLGAMGEDDIGTHFPDSDPHLKGAGSILFVKKVVSMMKKKGWKLLSLDSVIIAEAPKLSPYKAMIKKNLAKAFGIPASNVGLKAKTNEGFGAVGRNQAIACHVVVCLGNKKK